MTTLTIAAALEQIARDNDLTSVSVGFSRINLDGCERTNFIAYVNWKGYSRGGISCTQQIADAPMDAIKGAVLKSIAERTPMPTLPWAGERIVMEIGA